MTIPTEFSADGQASQVYAIFDVPAVVFACQVNQTFATHDKVVEFAFDNVTSGAYANVLRGMTIYLGSAPGLCDRGITYARKAPTSAKIYTGETSEVAWANNLYATVLQDWGPWVEYPTVLTDGTALMRHDIAYSDQHTNLDPVPMLGPDRVAKLSAASVSLTFSGSGSYAPGSSISAYSWSCAGATITGGSTAAPSLSFTSAGRYVLACTVTAANGKSSTTYRIIHIWDEAHPPANVIAGSLSGSWERGGWEFGLSVLDPASAIPERTRVILFSEDWYGATQTSFGPLPGAENIIAFGWLEREAITLDSQGGQLQFSIKGTQYWLDQIYDYMPLGLEAVSGSPTSWTQMQNLTVDKMLWHLLMWRSTLVYCVDILLTGYIRETSELSAQPGSLWDQIRQIAWTRMLATPCCDRYGRLIVQVETALHPEASRGSIPTTATLTADDCESIQIEKTSVTPTAQVILSGVTLLSGVGMAIFALSRGHIPLRFGSVLTIERLILYDQALANEQAANLLERENCPLRFTFNNLLANNRQVDVCPRQYVHATIAAADNARGLAYSGNVIVKTITMDLDESGAWSITWEADAETQGTLAVTGDVPQAEVIDGEVINGDPWKPPDTPPLPDPDPIVIIPPPSPASSYNFLALLIQGYGLWYCDMNQRTTITGDTDSTVWFNATADFTAGELAVLQHFDLCRVSKRAYLASSQSAWSTVLGQGSKTVIGTPATFLLSGMSSYLITGIGCNPDVDQKCGLTTILYYDEWPNWRWGAWLTGSETGRFANTYKTTFGIVFYTTMGNCNMVYYGGKWYFSYVNYLQGEGIIAMNDAMTAPVNSVEIGTWGGGWAWIEHARDADYIYNQNSASAVRVINDLATVQALGGGGSVTPQSMACSPDGATLMAGSGTLARKSTDYGATWSTLTGFPIAILTNSARVLNLGDSSRWVIVCQDDSYNLHVYYSADGGATWIDKRGNLGVIPSATPLVVRYG